MICFRDKFIDKRELLITEMERAAHTLEVEDAEDFGVGEWRSKIKALVGSFNKEKALVGAFSGHCENLCFQRYDTMSCQACVPATNALSGISWRSRRAVGQPR